MKKSLPALLWIPAILFCVWLVLYLKTESEKTEEVITVEAIFMQYACGDENDDMQVQKVDLAKYQFLVGKNVDPQVGLIPDTYELKDYMYANRSDSGFVFKVKGRLAKTHSGCDVETLKFWAEEIETIEGKNKMRKGDFKIKLM